MVKQAFKVGSIFALMGLFAAHSALLGFKKQSSWSLRRKRSKLAQIYSKWGLHVLGVKLHTQEKEGRSLEAALYVGNHLSYLDVLILASQIPTSFVTSEEIRATPVLGTLCELGGCLFVERRSRARLGAEVHELTDALQQGLNVTVFPEATSTNGEEVLRFRRPLFQAALNSGRAVAPFCLNYTKIDGQRIHLNNRDRICWYGDMDFVSHLWSLSSANQVEAQLMWLERQHYHNVEGISTELLANAAHAVVQKVFQPMNKTPDSTSPDWQFSSDRAALSV